MDSAYYASHRENGISTVEHIIIKNDSTASLLSKQIKSLADSDNVLVKQASLLINEQAQEIVRNLRTRIGHLQRREITANTKNKKASKTVAAKANTECTSGDFISNTSEASVEPLSSKSVALTSVVSQDGDQQR